jgi:uncharacterized membrane protein
MAPLVPRNVTRIDIPTDAGGDGKPVSVSPAPKFIPGSAVSTRVTGHTDRVTTLVSLSVLGLGVVAMALDVTGFWLVWAVGFGVVVPAVAVLRGRDGSAVGGARDGDGVDDALATLRERYARGELSEAAFEAKLEALLETETPEGARARLDRERASDAERET